MKEVLIWMLKKALDTNRVTESCDGFYNYNNCPDDGCSACPFGCEGNFQQLIKELEESQNED